MPSSMAVHFIGLMRLGFSLNSKPEELSSQLSHRILWVLALVRSPWPLSIFMSAGDLNSVLLLLRREIHPLSHLPSLCLLSTSLLSCTLIHSITKGYFVSLFFNFSLLWCKNFILNGLCYRSESMPLIPTLGKLRQEICLECEVTLSQRHQVIATTAIIMPKSVILGQWKHRNKDLITF